MLTPDETALDVYRRIFGKSFTTTVFDKRSNKVETLDFGGMLEVQTKVGQMTSAVLDLILSFAERFGDTAAVIHLSTGGNLRKSLLHGCVDVNGWPHFARMNQAGKVKEAVVGSLSELLGVLQILRDTLNGEPMLLVVEALSPLFLAMKPMDNTSTISLTSFASSSAAAGSGSGSSAAGSGTKSSTTLILEVLTALKNLGTQQNVIIVWFSTALPKNSGGLREGGPTGSWNQSLTNLWRDRCSRVIQYVGDD